MKPGNHITVTHLFAGGWATDYGHQFDTDLNTSNIIGIPYLLDTKNVTYNLRGNPRKIGGTAALNVSPMSGDPILGLYDFWRHDSSGFFQQKRIAYAGDGGLHADNADGNFSPLDFLSASAVPNFSQFDNLMIFSLDDGSTPKSYDGTTFQILSPTAPNFSFCIVHKNRVWAAGVPDDPSGLYYTSSENPTDWVGAGSGRLSISPGDGDSVRAIVSHKNDLWVFKGPNVGSIHRISGSAPTGSDAFNRKEFVYGLGAVSQNSVFRFRDDIGFIWSDGSFHSLAATAAYGDFYEVSLSRPINGYLKAHTRSDSLNKVWSATDISNGQVWVTLPINASSNNNFILLMDYRFEPVRWSYIDAYPARCLASVRDSSSQGFPIIMVGGDAGQIYKTQQVTKSINGIDAIQSKVTLPFVDYGMPVRMKTLANVGLGLASSGNNSVTFSWRRDRNAVQSDTVIQGGGDVLGPSATNPFTLNTSTLGGDNYTSRWINTIGGGEFRSIQYEVSQYNVDVDLNLQSIHATIEIGSDSLENT